jgi:hypothetical protein
LCSIGKGNNLTCRSAQSTHGTQGKEKKKKEEEEEKEKKVAFLLAIPGCLVNTLTIFMESRKLLLVAETRFSW